MKYTSFFLLFLFILNFSCKENKVVSDGLQTILLKESSDILPISSFVKDLEYIELQITDNKIELGEILDVKTINNELIVIQRRAKEISFLRFTKDGRFINQLVNNKEGAGDIPDPLDIISYKKDFAVLGKNGIYSIDKNGKFQSRLIHSKMPGSKLFQSKDNFFVVNEIPDAGFCSVFSDKKKPAIRAFPEERLRDMATSNITFNVQKEAHFFSSFSDTIFSFSGNSFIPVYGIDSGEYPSFAKVWSNLGDRNYTETLKYINNTQHAKIKSFLENDDYIFITYWLGSHGSTSIIKKDTWEVTYFAQAVNNIDGGLWDKPLYLTDNNELYIPITAYKVGGHKISDKRHHEFEKIQLHIAATGNPVIMCCKLR